MHWVLKVGVAGLMVGCLGRAGLAATYYVDFDGGKDSGTGLTAAEAFKHAPGDAGATGAAKGVVLGAGDEVLFKGGVIYRGAVVVKNSGEKGKPIVLDGNTAGTFGTGRAIIDGADAVTGWKKCASAEEAGGNSLWEQIFYADVPKAKEWRKASLCEEGKPLAAAQDPKPADPLFQEAIEGYHVVKGTLQKVAPAGKTPYMTLTDPAVFTQKDAEYYNGMTLGFHGSDNRLVYLKVVGYEPAEHRLDVELFEGKQYKETRYSLFNSVRLIGRAGEYSVDATADAKKSRVFLLPEKLEGGLPGGAGFSERATGIEVRGASDVEVRGFVIRRQGNGGQVCGVIGVGPAHDVTVRDCDISLVRGGTGMSFLKVDNLVVERCFVHDNPGHTQGIVVHTCIKPVVRDCRLQKDTSTGLIFYATTDGEAVGNVILDHVGMHANGMSFYVGCKNTLIDGNYVVRGQAAVTLQNGDGFMIRNNVFDGNGKSTAVGLWSSDYLKNVKIYYNLILGSDPKVDWSAGLYTNCKVLEGLSVRNNVIDGVASEGRIFSASDFKNNVYTRKGLDQIQGKVGAGEIFEADLGKIFVDAGKGDFRLKKDGAGSGAGVTVAGDGTEGKVGRAIDVGPFAMPAEAARTRSH